MELMVSLELRGMKGKEIQDNNNKDGVLTERLDAGGALKDGVGDVSLLKETAEEETTNTGSNNKHFWLDFSCHLFLFVGEKKGGKEWKVVRKTKVEKRDENEEMRKKRRKRDERCRMAERV